MLHENKTGVRPQCWYVSPPCKRRGIRSRWKEKQHVANPEKGLTRTSCWWVKGCKPATCTALLCLFICHSHQCIQHQGIVQPGVPLLQLLQEAGSPCCFWHLACSQFAQPLNEAWNIQKCSWKKRKKRFYYNLRSPQGTSTSILGIQKCMVKKIWLRKAEDGRIQCTLQLRTGREHPYPRNNSVLFSSLIKELIWLKTKLAEIKQPLEGAAPPPLSSNFPPVVLVKGSLQQQGEKLTASQAGSWISSSWSKTGGEHTTAAPGVRVWTVELHP